MENFLREEAASEKAALQETRNELRHPEAKYRVLMENVNEGILIIQDGGIKYANSRAVEICGFAPEELTSPSQFANILLPADDRQTANAGREENGDRIFPPHRGPFRIVDRQGKERRVEGNSVPYEWGGRPAALFFFRDVTGCEQVEEALRRSEARYRRIVETANEGILDLDANFRIAYVNRNMAEMLGFTAEELIGRPIEELELEEERSLTERRRERRIQGRGEKFERRLRCKDGTIKWFQVSASAKMDEQNGFQGTFGMFTDITEQKRAVEELKERERRLDAFLQGSPIPAFVIGKDHRVLIWNKALQELSGIKAEEVIGTNRHWRAFYRVERPCLADLLVDEDLEGIARWYPKKSTQSNLIAEAYEATDFFPALAKGGRWLRFTGAIIRDIQENVIGGLETLEDITEKVKAERALKKSNRQLRALSARVQAVREEERAAIAREIHDELGQTLLALKMDISWLARHMPKEGGTWIRRARSMSRLVDGTIDTVRRISSALRPGLLDDLGLKAAMEWQLEEFQGRTGIECKFTSNREEFPLKREQRTAAFRIFQETLTNAARHSKTRRLEVELNAQDGTLILEVRDFGSGISRGKISSPRSLGILGMRERTMLLGGEFQIRGVRGKGTTVTVKIPLRRRPGRKE